MTDPAVKQWIDAMGLGEPAAARLARVERENAELRAQNELHGRQLADAADLINRLRDKAASTRAHDTCAWRDLAQQATSERDEARIEAERLRALLDESIAHRLHLREALRYARARNDQLTARR